MEPRTVYIGNTVEKQMALIQIGICGNGSWLSDLPIDEQTVTLYEALGGGCQAGEAGPTDSSTVAPPRPCARLSRARRDAYGLRACVAHHEKA